MSSSRLPGKVLAEIAGRPALCLLLKRLQAAREVASIVVGTSIEPADDAIVDAAERAGVLAVRGPLEDVLDRYRIAAEAVDCDAVVRITGDCPLVDPDVVDLVVRTWRETRADFVANCLPPLTFPDGFDVELMSRSALERAAALASAPADREHVTPFIRRASEAFSRVAVVLEPSYGHLRVTLDTAEDLEQLRAIAGRLGPDARLEAIIAELVPEPSLRYLVRPEQQA